jgi:ATP:ADP antiporter, AAA family
MKGLHFPLWATSWFFCILLSYSVVRPIRETMGAIGGVKQLKGLMLVTFLVMLVAVPAYSALVARLPRRWVVRVVFHFFCLSLVAFSFAMRSPDEAVQVWSARVFFVWVNVFALFATSVFWSVLADLYYSDEGKQMFGKIAAGGTAGAILGSLLTSQLATRLSTANLLLVPIVGLQLGLWFAWRLERQASSLGSSQEAPTEAQSVNQSALGQPTGGGLMTGITRILASPYLASICVFLFFVQAYGTHLYLQQAEIVQEAIPDKAEKTELFAYLDFGTQTLTLLIQSLLAGPILKRLGVSVALVILPVVYGVAFSALALSPELPMLIASVIATRSAAYGITVPAREVLFTVVDREDKYKSKSFIDTVVLRGGDTISSQLIGSLRDVAGMSFVLLNWLALPLASVWALVAWHLGRQQKSRTNESA